MEEVNIPGVNPIFMMENGNRIENTVVAMNVLQSGVGATRLRVCMCVCHVAAGVCPLRAGSCMAPHSCSQDRAERCQQVCGNLLQRTDEASTVPNVRNKCRPPVELQITYSVAVTSQSGWYSLVCAYLFGAVVWLDWLLSKVFM